MSYIGKTASSATQNIFKFVPSSSATTVTGADAFGRVLSMPSNQDAVSVFLNGILLLGRGVDYSLSTSTVTFTSAYAISDEIIIITLEPFAVADHLKKSTGGTIEGGLTVNGAFTSKGIDDNADATAITITSAEAVGIGTSLTPNNYSNYQVVTIGGSNATTGSALDFEDSDGNIEGYISGTAGRLYLEADSGNATASSFMHLGVDGNQVLKLDASRNVTITDGNLVVASGHGIDFSATGDGTGANQHELLDDYERGTWTPTLPSGGTIDAINSATFTKIGNVVRLGFYITMSSIPNNSSAFYIGGLPFVVAYDGAGGQHYHGAGAITYVGGHDINGFGMLPPTPWTNNDDLYFHRGDGNSSTVTNSNMHGCPYIICATSYITNA